MDLTVAICTYRRPKLLRSTLQSLAQCDPIDQTWELLVVDNGGDPQINDIVESFADCLPAHYRHEPDLGTSFARNHAVRRALAPVIVFTDDDVTFDHRWLLSVAHAIDTQRECAFWGGRVEPVWPFETPRWFDPMRCAMLGDVIVRYELGTQSRSWQPDRDPPFCTANLAFRTEAIKDAGFFDTTVGHRGDRRMGMEDSLMVQAIAQSDGKGYYMADAKVYHPVGAERITKQYARRFARRQGWLSVYMLCHQPPLRRVPRWLYRVAAQGVLQGAGRWLRGTLTANAPEQFAGQMTALFNLSKLYHAFRTPRRGMSANV